MNVQEFTKVINRLRRDNKNSWYHWRGTVQGIDVALKGYRTWLQMFKVARFDCGGCADISVKKFVETLEAPFSNALLLETIAKEAK